jgi:DNA replication protein DnaD
LEIDFPPEMKAFLDDVVDSFVVWDLLIFFSKKEGEMESPEQIAKLLGRQTAEMEKPMAKLEKMGLLTQVKRLDGETACQLNRGGSLFHGLEKFWAFNENQENRLRILSYLLQKKAR